METKSLSSLRSAEDSFSFITEAPLWLEAAVKEVECPNHGAIVSFVGRVRDKENEEHIKAIVYEAYTQMAESEIKKIIEQVQKQWSVRVTVKHRIGRIGVGEASVIIACAAPHRKEAFEACRFVIDRLKETVPIWKARYEK